MKKKKLTFGIIVICASLMMGGCASKKLWQGSEDDNILTTVTKTTLTPVTASIDIVMTILTGGMWAFIDPDDSKRISEAFDIAGRTSGDMLEIANDRKAAKEEAERLAKEREEERKEEIRLAKQKERERHNAEILAQRKERERLAKQESERLAAQKESERLAAQQESQRLAQRQESQQLAAQQESERLAAQRQERLEQQKAKKLAAQKEYEQYVAQQKAKQLEAQQRAEEERQRNYWESLPPLAHSDAKRCLEFKNTLRFNHGSVYNRCGIGTNVKFSLSYSAWCTFGKDTNPAYEDNTFDIKDEKRVSRIIKGHTGQSLISVDICPSSSSGGYQWTYNLSSVEQKEAGFKEDFKYEFIDACYSNFPSDRKNPDPC